MLLFVLAALVIGLSVVAIFRGVDVRLTLLAAAFALAAMAGDLRPVLRKFLSTFSDEKFVVPICSAMGFAYVLKRTACDQHLVLLLTQPLRRARVLLIPGVALVGFLVNIPVISQTSTAVCLGAVVIPLMRAGGISPLTIGATLVLGSSIGGELLNPGAPELNTVAEKLHRDPRDVLPAIGRLVFYQLALSIGIFWLLSERFERRRVDDSAQTVEPTEKVRVHFFRAMVPLVPLALLFLTGPPFSIFAVPLDWVADEKTKSVYATRLIGLAMIIGALVAGLSVPRHAGTIAKTFFEGAGYAFANIVSLIVTASCFGTAVEQIGLTAWLERSVRLFPDLLLPIAAIAPLLFAALSGSGMASTQSLFGLFVSPAESIGMDCLDLGAIVAIGAAAGRTMSPVAAVTLMCAAMTSSNPLAVAKRVAPPLLVSWAIVVALRMLGWL